MNQGTAQDYEYRVVAESEHGGTWLPYGTRSYPTLSTARGLASNQRRYYGRVWIERRSVATKWEVVE